ncbi:uncharacterized protein LAESUDRAFT_717270 [Laetiporus sulphureus 93-53]|uniref:Uncharacterized protein n=1 Tax=Laetiporus sulphureus 93-53 TaxID=1314785 RepID=A0A165BWM2_9APHY|nr:uncharacterized protein LAESUDRAFT_717270 [Laetiporus sulphureus 93-53]KZT01786.1 hypothetical protein LAESUDRAFT_717270 [Laetiporus sulphureus 93-53]
MSDSRRIRENTAMAKDAKKHLRSTSPKGVIQGADFSQEGQLRSGHFAEYEASEFTSARNNVKLVDSVTSGDYCNASVTSQWRFLRVRAACSRVALTVNSHIFVHPYSPPSDQEIIKRFLSVEVAIQRDAAASQKVPSLFTSVLIMKLTSFAADSSVSSRLLSPLTNQASQLTK